MKGGHGILCPFGNTISLRNTYELVPEGGPGRRYRKEGGLQVRALNSFKLDTKQGWTPLFIGSGHLLDVWTPLFSPDPYPHPPLFPPTPHLIPLFAERQIYHS